MSLTTALSAGAVGLALGYLGSRHTVCFNAGVRRGTSEGDWSILRIFGVAVGFQLLLLPLLVALGVSPLERSTEAGGLSLVPVSQLAGGLVFGAGMALAGGCIAGILWKSGAGSIATAIAIGGFVVGELVARGPLSDAVASINDMAQASDTGLPDLIGADYTPVALVAGVVVLFSLGKRSPKGFVVGAALALVAAAAWVAADASGYGYGLGFVGGAESTREAIASGGELPFQLWLALGVVGGAAVAINGPLRRPDAGRAGRALAGGILMGVGGTLAGACNIGHGLAGLPLLSLGSGLAIASMALGGALTWRYVVSPRPRLRGTERPEPSW